MPYPTTHPSKEAVRQYMADRQKATTPPPNNQEVRDQLGWKLLQPYDKDRS